MKEEVLKVLQKAVSAIGIDPASVSLEYTENLEHGDLTSNVAMVNAKKLAMNPRALAEKIVAELEKNRAEDGVGDLAIIEKISIAGPGFINFKIKDAAFVEGIISPADKNNQNASEILVEHTDPNTFKPFHIGHLMANAIGESLYRLTAHTGAKVTRICYPADIGLHIAKAIWAMKKHESEIPHENESVIVRTGFLGKMYVEGTASYDADPKAKAEIEQLNKIIYERSDSQVNALYEKGRRWSLEHFEMLYKRLGTSFDEYIYESEMAPVGLEKVKAELAKGVFEKSEGAIVFPGEKYGLHTRVFINAMGLPTYEAKDIGLNLTKFAHHPKVQTSIIVTANEQNDYFKVLIKALSEIDANVGARTKHIGHGMLRLASGKMSSRTGKVITAEDLIDEIKKMVMDKIADRGFSPDEADKVADMIAIGAIKYTILRQAIGGDVIFDSAASISFEGDSGPYLQYSAVRAGAILEKAKAEGVRISDNGERSKAQNPTAQIATPEKVGELERMLARFTDVADRASREYAPQLIANYLINLASLFNSFYGSQIIVDKKDALSPYRVALTARFRETMISGLDLLGIKVPERM